MADFDYGNKLPNGQHEHHPVKQEGNYVAPIRNSYIHETCNGKTLFGDSIAETYAKHPKYYGRTFCSKCGDYFSVSQFRWAADGVAIGELGGEPGADLREEWPKYAR